MKFLIALLFIFSIAFTSCGDAFSSFESKDLYGQWQGDTWGFTFNEDGSCEVLKNGNLWPGETTWRKVAVGNTLEFVANGKVFLSNVTVKGIQNDTLSIEMRPMFRGAKAETTTVVSKLVRVK